MPASRPVGLSLGVAALLVISAVVNLPTLGHVPPTTAVSLTFDDGHADQWGAARALHERGLVGTFFVNSGFVGSEGFMPLARLHDLVGFGDEIGGHTVSHPDLAAIDPVEARLQLCNDRVTLSRWGFDVRSLAYPFASTSPAVEKIAAECGYTSARGLGDIRTRFGCATCARAEVVPPPDPMLTRAPTQVDATWTLDDLTSVVTQAEAAGGWVQLTFHRVCDDGCDPLAITPALFDRFADWLVQRTRERTTTVVATVQQVLGGPLRPVISGGGESAVRDGNLVSNPGLEERGADGVPVCWSLGEYGANDAAVDYDAEPHGGATAARLLLTAYGSGDAKLLPALDQGSCSPPAASGHRYALSAWYRSTAVTQFAVYRRDGQGVWSYWTSSPWFDAADEYTTAIWTTPRVPKDTEALSFGLNLFSDGRLTTDDYAMVDAGPGNG
ncbi:polysaccharide deacetylase family protein [Galbitalea sp. SE-J8]|uniref:polysaccharide deacetylase family protein n=1 Tax=Galbitalea sp. SE-J8 TaxID=3054952 RepID=UPI00259D2D37|nr:polysaccharide deacetylase family protein [Galbitalea sp. SE-J8]MDM4763266.1 polysaccharide deacetylase family protein [Galbitalea sp. SE-J8]